MTEHSGPDTVPGHPPPSYAPQQPSAPKTPPDPIGTITPEEGLGLARALILIDRGIRKSGYAGPPGHGLALALAALAQSSLGVTTPPLPAPPTNGGEVEPIASSVAGQPTGTNAAIAALEKELDDLAANYDARLADIEKEIGLDPGKSAKKPAPKK